jgi:L-fuconolactonase
LKLYVMNKRREMAEIIDAHHHLWHYNPLDLPWITPELETLRADFLPAGFESAMGPVGVRGSVVVQARHSLAETEWLLDLAESSTAILGVVGWLPLASPDLPRLLDRFAGRAKLKGIRHIVQDEPDPDFLTGAEFNAGVAAAGEAGLVYDILIYESQLPLATEFVRRHPRQSFVLDHCGKPKIAGQPGSQTFTKWCRGIRTLALEENVCCKISGLATQTCHDKWCLDDLRPCLDTVLDAFGPQRLMAASDWPVCLLRSGYGQWWSALDEWASNLDVEAREDIFGATARRFYHLD